MGIFDISSWLIFRRCGSAQTEPCGCRITGDSIISEFLGNKHQHSALSVWVESRSSLWISHSLFSSVHTHSWFLGPALPKSIFSFHVFPLGDGFFPPAWSTGRKCHPVKCQLKLSMQTLLGSGVSWHFPPWVQSVCFAQLKQKLKAPKLMRVAQGSSWFAPVSLLL